MYLSQKHTKQQIYTLKYFKNFNNFVEFQALIALSFMIKFYGDIFLVLAKLSKIVKLRRILELIVAKLKVTLKQF